MTMRIVLILLAAALAGCTTSGPKYSEIKSSIPELSPDQGRIYFYRPGPLGVAVKPNIVLNGSVVGELLAQGFFFVDRPPGTYLAIARTESEASVQIPLAANETRYVRGSLTLGLFVGRPQLVLTDARDAMIELVELAYTGSAPLSAGVRSAPPAAADGAAAAGGTQMKDLEGLLPGK